MPKKLTSGRNSTPDSSPTGSVLSLCLMNSDGANYSKKEERVSSRGMEVGCVYKGGGVLYPAKFIACVRHGRR